MLFENEGSLYELGYELMGSEIPPVLTTSRCRDAEHDNLGIVNLHSPILGHLASVLFALPLVEAFEDLGGRMIGGVNGGN